MDEKELARLVAADFGPDVERAVANPDDVPRTRGFVEAIAIAGAIANVIQVVVQLWQVRQDRALLLLALAEGLDRRDTTKPDLTAGLDDEKRLKVMASVANRIAPEHFGSSPSLPAEKPRTKKEWMADWLGYDADTMRTRAMTAPVLLPFADMDKFAVYTPIYWTPPEGAPSNLPRAVTVPKGFTTDLSSIPDYFLWAVSPTGRHGHAAIIHDWLYWEQSVSRSVADKVFETVMGELDVALATRKAMWAAVRVGGGGYWTEASEEKRRGGSRVLKRLPDKPVVFLAEDVGRICVIRY